MRKFPAFLLLLLAIPIGWLIWLDRSLEARFASARATAASTLYARPLELEPGASLEKLGLAAALARLGYREVVGPLVGEGEYAVAGGEWILGLRPAQGGPGGRVSLLVDGEGTLRAIRAATGETLGRVALEGEAIAEIHGDHRIRREPLQLVELPATLIEAIVHTEDRHFFSHPGLDLWRIGGAAWANLRAGRIVQGGSTITQQLVKNLFLSSERTFSRKLREGPLAFLLELHHPKHQILEAYLNEIYLGQDGSIAVHGVGAAARHYFGKRAQELTLGEGALLAGMIAAPGVYSPFRDPAAALERRDLVLARLLESERVTREEVEAARAEPLRTAQPPRERALAPHFAQWLVDQLPSSLDAATLSGSGHALFSTLDVELQGAAVQAIARTLEQLEREQPDLAERPEPLEAALVALDPRTGDVLALVGGRDFARSQFNRATQARRQPGSAFKPLVALAALSAEPDVPPRFTLVSKLADEALEVDTPEGTWIPANFDGQFRGEVTLREALERSYNVPFARLGLSVGSARIASVAHQLGITSDLRTVPSLALGSSEVTLLEIVRAYGTLAAAGVRSEIRAYRSVQAPDGTEVVALPPQSAPAFGAAETFLVTSALLGAVERGTGRGLRALGLHVPVAGKTGTSNDFRDGWFIGYGPHLVVGVWVGFDDGSSMGLPASRTALPIFAEFASVAQMRWGFGAFAFPDGVESVQVDPISGRLAATSCPGSSELFLDGTAPTERCEEERWREVSPLRWLFKRLGR